MSHSPNKPYSEWMRRLCSIYSVSRHLLKATPSKNFLTKVSPNVRMSTRKEYNAQGYLLIDGAPFYPIRRPRHPPKASSESAIHTFLCALNALDFEHSLPAEVLSLTEKIAKEKLYIPLGSVEVFEYFLNCEVVQTGSLNPAADHTREESAHVPVLLKSLVFTNVNGVPGAQSSRLVLPLGRLHASHHSKGADGIQQSRWVVALDQTHLLWALYADDIDGRDVLRSKDGTPREYSFASDTAFGANRAGGQKVVFLGSIRDDVPFKIDKQLGNVSVQDGLGWSTYPGGIDIRSPVVSPSSVEQFLGLDTQFFDMPDSTSGILDVKDIFALNQDYGYITFCNDIQKVNKFQKGFVVGREMVNAAWYKVVTWVFKISNEGVRLSENGTGIKKRINAFNDCVMQCYNAKANSYWKNLASHHPGMVISAIPGLSVAVSYHQARNCAISSNFQQASSPGMSVDNIIPLQKYLLETAKNFEYPKSRTTKKKLHFQDGMDLDNVPESMADGNTTTTSLNEAEKRGWIRFYKQDTAERFDLKSLFAKRGGGLAKSTWNVNDASAVEGEAENINRADHMSQDVAHRAKPGSKRQQAEAGFDGENSEQSRKKMKKGDEGDE